MITHASENNLSSAGAALRTIAAPIGTLALARNPKIKSLENWRLA